MFKITPVRPEDTSRAIEYLKPDKNGIILACYENNDITGAVCFDIDGDAAFLDKLKIDEPVMEEIMLKSAMNFLDLHGIYNFYLPGEKDLYKLLGFKKSDRDDYKMYINLEGYFEIDKCHN
ncbi:MAG: hypothetical protein WCX81_04055 [Monoglobales bacterium]